MSAPAPPPPGDPINSDPETPGVSPSGAPPEDSTPAMPAGNESSTTGTGSIFAIGCTVAVAIFIIIVVIVQVLR